jgi:hypothetical protein
MPRSKKATVDYFPHSCLHGRTLHIIESKFGNDGYAFWFKLLELLGSTENHYIDCNDPATWEYLLAQTRVSGETAGWILNLLAALGAIHEPFWKFKVVWSENFVRNLEAVYQRRRIDLYTMSNIKEYCQQKGYLNGINVNINPQSKVKESKGKESKVKYSLRFLKFYEAYPKKEAKAEAEKAFIKICPDDQLLEKMLASIAWQIKTEKWQKDGGKYIPMPSTWLNQRRWEDEPLACSAVQKPNDGHPDLSKYDDWDELNPEHLRAKKETK